MPHTGTRRLAASRAWLFASCLLVACASTTTAHDDDSVDVGSRTDGGASSEAGVSNGSSASSGASASGGASSGGGSDSGVESSSSSGALFDLGCEAPITTPPAPLLLNAFYTRYLNARGVPVVSSDAPDEAALRVACRLALPMLVREDARVQLIARHVRIGVMGKNQLTTDMPEHSDLNQVFPDVDWDARARGLGATDARPLSSCAEENVLCLPGDRYVGENIFVHEFGHTVLNLGLQLAEPSFGQRVDAAYAAAVAAGRFANTYADDNRDEYWAEGVQSWFGVNLEAVPPNGIHNSVNTRAELEAYDPILAALIAEAFPGQDLQPLCP